MGPDRQLAVQVRLAEVLDLSAAVRDRQSEA
jgi:hypothetical protein